MGGNGVWVVLGKLVLGVGEVVKVLCLGGGCGGRGTEGGSCSSDG